MQYFVCSTVDRRPCLGPYTKDAAITAHNRIGLPMAAAFTILSRWQIRDLYPQNKAGDYAIGQAVAAYMADHDRIATSHDPAGGRDTRREHEPGEATRRDISKQGGNNVRS